jgi:hypothetical protein
MKRKGKEHTGYWFILRPYPRIRRKKKRINSHSVNSELGVNP